jgi:hypothetical protein
MNYSVPLSLHHIPEIQPPIPVVNSSKKEEPCCFSRPSLGCQEGLDGAMLWMKEQRKQMRGLTDYQKGILTAAFVQCFKKQKQGLPASPKALESGPQSLGGYIPTLVGSGVQGYKWSSQLWQPTPESNRATFLGGVNVLWYCSVNCTHLRMITFRCILSLRSMVCTPFPLPSLNLSYRRMKPTLYHKTPKILVTTKPTL